MPSRDVTTSAHAQPRRRPLRPRYLGLALAAGLLLGSAAFADEVEPLQLPAWSGEDGSSLTPSVQLQGAYFAQSGSWYGRSRANLGESSGDWVEGVLSLGADGVLALGEAGSLYGGVTALGAGTALGTDAAGTNAASNQVSDSALERYVLGWRSGHLIEGLDEDALDLSIGKQTYQIGSGFLFWDAGSDGGDRGAFWIGPYQAFERTAVARVSSFGLTGNLAYLSPNDNPDTNTELWTADLAYERDGLGNIGGGFSHIFESDLASRDGMNVWDIRAELTPLSGLDVLPGLTLKGEYVQQDNGDRQRGDGWYGELGYDFAAVLPWSPYLGYRYASFSGDSPDSARDQGFDPLFYGFSDWGTWFQGEVLGEYVLLNQNLKSHTVRLRLEPTDSLTVNLLYFRFLLDNPASFGTESDQFADEVNVILDYSWSDNLSFSVVGAWSQPDDGAEEFTGGDDDWLYGMLYTSISF